MSVRRRRDSSLATQCAVPGACFESLREFLGNTIECFASPLNCRFERYFSAFPGLEGSFGSLGSFFDEWHRIEAGSFEVNPPFVPEVLAFAAALLQEVKPLEVVGDQRGLGLDADWLPVYCGNVQLQVRDVGVRGVARGDEVSFVFVSLPSDSESRNESICQAYAALSSRAAGQRHLPR